MQGEGPQLSRKGNTSTTTDQKFENATQVKFHLSLDTDRDVSTPTKKTLDNPKPVKDRFSFGTDTGTSIKSTTLERSIQTLSPILTPLTDFAADENSISTDSLPLMNRIHKISNCTTPELSFTLLYFTLTWRWRELSFQRRKTCPLDYSQLIVRRKISNSLREPVGPGPSQNTTRKCP